MDIPALSDKWAKGEIRLRFVGDQLGLWTQPIARLQAGTMHEIMIVHPPGAREHEYQDIHTGRVVIYPHQLGGGETGWWFAPMSFWLTNGVSRALGFNRFVHVECDSSL